MEEVLSVSDRILVMHEGAFAGEVARSEFGEEAVEAIVAAVSGDRDGLAAEAADVLYHLLVLLAAAGAAEAEPRPAGRAGRVEQATQLL